LALDKLFQRPSSITAHCSHTMHLRVLLCSKFYRNLFPSHLLVIDYQLINWESESLSRQSDNTIDWPVGGIVLLATVITVWRGPCGSPPGRWRQLSVYSWHLRPDEQLSAGLLLYAACWAVDWALRRYVFSLHAVDGKLCKGCGRAAWH